MFRINASGPEAIQCARITGPSSGRTQSAHSQTQLHSSTDGLDHILQNQPGSSLVLAGCQVLAKQIRPRSKPECKNHSLYRLLSLSRLDVNWIWHVYWDPDKSQLRRTFVTMKRAVYPCSARGRHNQHGSPLLMFSVLL